MKMTSHIKRIMAVMICIPFLLGTTLFCGCDNNYKSEKPDAQEDTDSRNRDLIASNQSSIIRFKKIDNDHISVGDDGGASEYSRTEEPTEEDKQTIAIFR